MLPIPPYSEFAWIPVDVCGEVEELVVVLHVHCVEWSLKEMAAPFVFRVEVLRIAIEQSLHESGDAILRVFNNDRMEVIRHERERNDTHARAPHQCTALIVREWKGTRSEKSFHNTPETQGRIRLSEEQ
jgi:hypothetical protein